MTTLGFFTGEAVKVVVHTVEPDLYRKYGRIVDIGVSQVLVDFGQPGLPTYWMDPSILKDAGAAL